MVRSNRKAGIGAGLLCILLALPGYADRYFVNDTEACPKTEEEQDSLIDFAAEGGLILNDDGFSSMEYFCEFQPNLQFHWDGIQATTHMGHCQTPGPVFTPMLFTFVMSEEDPGEIVLYDGSEHPIRFYSCTD